MREHQTSVINLTTVCHLLLLGDLSHEFLIVRKIISVKEREACVGNRCWDRLGSNG